MYHAKEKHDTYLIYHESMQGQDGRRTTAAGNA
jgi:hypothetical protein